MRAGSHDEADHEVPRPNSAKDALKLLAYLDKHPFVLAPLSDRVLVDTLREKRARALHAVYCAKAA